MAEVNAVAAAIPAVSKTQAKRIKRGSIHTYKTKAGTRFLVQVRLKGTFRSKAFDNMKDAKAWRLAQQAELANGEEAPRVPNKMKMPDLFAAFVKGREENGDPVSDAVSMMFDRLAAHDAFSETLVSKVDYALVRDYCVARKASGIHPSTIQSEFVRIDLALKKVGQWLNWKNFNPLKDARGRLRDDKLICDSNKRHRRPEPEEMDALLKHFREYESFQRAAGVPENEIIPMADIVSFAALNAFRRGEITQLRWDELASNSITCWRKDCTAPFFDEEHKGKRADMTPVLRAARPILERQPRREGEPRIFPFNPDTISQRFTDACKKLGIDDLRFHDLRHEAISQIAQHVGMVEAMQVSGHKTVKAFKLYVNFSDDDAGRIINKLDAVALPTAQ